MVMKTIMVDGDKGGVGKSLVARIIADLYLHADAAALPHPRYTVGVIDTDLSNPDVCGSGGFTIQDGVALAALASLEDAEGWAAFVDQLSDLQSRMRPEEEVRVIVSLPAQITHRAFGGAIPAVGDILRMFGAVPVWVLNRTRESANALAERHRLLPEQYQRGLAVKNLFFGSAAHFLSWEAHPIYQELVVSGTWIEGELPELYALLSNKIGRTPFGTAYAVGTQTGPLSAGEKVMLNAWRGRCWATLSALERL
ncbi:MAG: hypothetical protein ACYDHM_02970 [Acidiferrobacterales bacterium]